MGDDAIGIKVLEEISCELVQEDIEIIYGETDNEYALKRIQDGDLVYVIDSTYFGLEPGTVTFTPLDNVIINGLPTTQHQPNLIYLIKLYGIEIKGFVIGIEISNVEFSVELSDALKLEFKSICNKVVEFIKENIAWLCS